jgi:hypothetical protein
LGILPVQSDLSHESSASRPASAERRLEIQQEFEEENSAVGRARSFKSIGASMADVDPISKVTESGGFNFGAVERDSSATNSEGFSFASSVLNPAKEPRRTSTERFNFAAGVSEKSAGLKAERVTRFMLGRHSKTDQESPGNPMEVDEDAGGVYRAPTQKRPNKLGEDQPELKLIRIPERFNQLCGGQVSGGLKVCLQVGDECSYESHKKTKAKFSSGGWGVEAPSSSRVPVSCFCKPFLPEAVAESSEVFAMIKEEEMELSRWVEVFDYISNTFEKGESEDPSTVRRLREVTSNATPKKRSKLEFSSPPIDLEFTGDSAGTEWLLSWHRETKVWMRQTAENFADLEAAMFKHKSALGTTVPLDGSMVPTVWEGIRTAHEAARSIGVEATMARTTAGRALSLVTSLETGEHSVIRKLQDEIRRLKRETLSEADFDLEMAALNKELKAALDGIQVTFQGMQRQVPAGRSAFSNLSAGVAAPNPTPIHSGSAIDEVKKSLMVEINNVSARIDADAYCVRGRWFRTMDDCISFSRHHIPEGQFQWFVDVVSYLQFTTDIIVDTDESQKGEIHEARVKRTQEQSTVIASFRTGVPPIFAGPKASRDSADPYSAIKTPQKWNGHDYLTGVFPRAEKSLREQSKKLDTAFTRELAAHPEALALATTLLTQSETCFAKLGAGVEAFNKYLLTTTYGRDSSRVIPKAAQEECWTVVKNMIAVFFRELRRVRVGAETAYTATDPHVRVGHYLWHTLQAHRIMDEFLETTFQAHPLVAPNIVMYLFEHRAPRSEVEALSTLVTAQAKTLAEQSKEIKVLKANMDKVFTDLKKKKDK